MQTIPDVARWLRVHKSTVYRLIASGELERVKIGRSVRICDESLAAFISRGGTRGGSRL